MHKNDFSYVWLLPERKQKGKAKRLCISYWQSLMTTVHLSGKNGHCWAWNTSLYRRNISYKQNLPWLLLTLGDKDTSRHFRQPGSTSLLFRRYRYCLDTYFKILPYTSKYKPYVYVVTALVQAIWVWGLSKNRISVIYIKYGTDDRLERGCQVQHSDTWLYWFCTFPVILHHVPLVSGNLYNFYADINCDKKGIKKSLFPLKK